MKNLLLIILYIALSFPLIGQQLKVLSEPYFQETMSDVKFVDESTGWLVGNKGKVYKTTDGGMDWFMLDAGTTKDLVKASFIDSNTGWVATIDGSVFKTTDGGLNWTEYKYDQAVPGLVFSICYVLKFLDNNTGFIVAGKLRALYLLKTIDGGINWSVKDSLVSATLDNRWFDIDFSGSNGVIVGNKKDVQKYTTDLGETWNFSTPINDNFFRDLKYVKFLTPTDVITIGEGNEFSGVPVPVYKSTDSGINWVKKNQSLLTVYDRVKDAYFKNNLEGIGVGSDGFSKAFFVKTTDGGETWTPQVLDYAFGLQAVAGIGDFLYVLGTTSHFIYSYDFGNTWQFLNKKPPSAFKDFSFVNGRGYSVTRNGDVYFSSDGTGNSWEFRSIAGKNIAGAMVFLPNDKGFILKENRHIVKTTDFAQTWETVLFPVSAGTRNLVGGLDFGDLNTGYAWFSLNQYGDYYVFKTSDGGDNWSQIKYFGGPGYISGEIIAFNADNVVILGPDTWTQRTTDGGVNWSPASLINFPEGFGAKDFEGAVKIDENRAIAIGEKFICITADKGANWNYINHGLNNIDSNFYKIAFSSDTLGYITLYNGTILKTTDLGNSWTIDETYFEQYFFYASAINESGKLMLGTSAGYTLGEETPSSIEDENNKIPDNFILLSNYPNPFNPSTIISWQSPAASWQVLKVFDVLGNEIATLIDEYKPAGKNEVEFNASQLSSGVYFYQLRAGKFVETKKMLYLR